MMAVPEPFHADVQQAPDSEIEIKGEVSGLTAGTHGMRNSTTFAYQHAAC